jgi:hypothetical protein
MHNALQGAGRTRPTVGGGRVTQCTGVCLGVGACRREETGKPELQTTRPTVGAGGR